MISELFPEEVLVGSIHAWEYQRDFFVRLLDIEFAVDAGANVGQWATSFRRISPNSKILSFEPDKRCEASLQTLARRDSAWEIRFVGLGLTNSIESLNLWDVEGGSSSFRHLNEAGEGFTGWLNEEMGHVQIEVNRLDSHLSSDYVQSKSSMLKIDVQGYELEVLQGCGSLLPLFKLIEIEMPLVELYEGSAGAGNLINFLEGKGFTLVSLATERWAYPGAADCDALFVRSDIYKKIKSPVNQN
jgi:FkbM family methyltransferase